MPRLVVGIVAAAFALAIGFASGALLSRPSIKSTDAKIKAVEDDKVKLLEESEQVKGHLSLEQDNNSQLSKSLKRLENENGKLIQQVSQLKYQNESLLEKVVELKRLKEKLIEKALN